jgi:hypothetical protein
MSGGRKKNMAIKATYETGPRLCGKCGAELKYESAGPGGGRIVCPNCGPTGGVFDCGLPDDYWDKFDKLRGPKK